MAWSIASTKRRFARGCRIKPSGPAPPPTRCPSSPAASPGRQFVIPGGHDRIYLAELVDQPQPHFNTVAEQSVGAFAIVSPLLVVDKTAFAVCDGGQLTRFALPALENVGQTNLPGEVVGRASCRERG